MTTLQDGRPIFVEGDSERIGRGPWARWLATSVVPDERSPRAERGRTLARSGHVHSVTIAEGEITALVIGSAGAEYRVGFAADPVAPRVWSAVVGSLRGRTLFEAAAAGREQSLQLEHVMTVDWEEPLIPPTRSVRRSCTCPDADRSGACKHVAALAYVVADAIDSDPSLLLEWRGCTDQSGPSGRPSVRRRSAIRGRQARCPSSRRACAPGRLRAQASRGERPRRRRRRSPRRARAGVRGLFGRRVAGVVEYFRRRGC